MASAPERFAVERFALERLAVRIGLGDRRSRVQISAARQTNILFEQAFRRFRGFNHTGLPLVGKAGDPITAPPVISISVRRGISAHPTVILRDLEDEAGPDGCRGSGVDGGM